MADASGKKIPAIEAIKDPALIRVVIQINGELVHVPLSEILKALDARVTALENP